MFNNNVQYDDDSILSHDQKTYDLEAMVITSQNTHTSSQINWCLCHSFLLPLLSITPGFVMNLNQGHISSQGHFDSLHM